MSAPSSTPSIHADDEWSPLKAVIVGRAGRACFPAAPPAMIASTMPAAHVHRFRSRSPFPEDLIEKAEAELDCFAAILRAEGIRVYRPPSGIDWLAEEGYTGAMPRDGLISVGNTLVEACFAWECRSREIKLAYGAILEELALQDPRARIIRRPGDTFANNLLNKDGPVKANGWIINNSRPAFDAADFMRFGTVILGQYSHVTNQAGVDYLQRHLPAGYRVEMLTVNDPNAMHIDATILPLRQGLLVYNPNKVTEAALRAHEVLADWELVPYPFDPQEPEHPPLFMTSPWLCLNALVLDGKKMIVEAGDDRTAEWFETLGMTCIRCPFRHVNSIGGSFHCATVDLAFDAFRARILLEEPQSFPCIYATKGFKANEHRFCFVDHAGSDAGTPIANATLDRLAAAFDDYAQNWRQFGPMTSLVVLTPLPPAASSHASTASLADDRQRFWDLLRGISDRDPHSWPATVPQDVEKPAWTLMFRGERFVALALTPRYQNRQSRFCAGFVLAFQPIKILQDLLSTPEKMASAVGTVRALTDSQDAVPYSDDVIAVGEGRQSVSTMFFLSDDGESWGSLYSKIRSK
ncbi:glycine amidinotransferase, mitochondrial [Aspergillus udagawae]|uniref:Glycine amidinotransferase, mitochondrial n=1 Tax=Aspergillus udagawae TaxID=91492 RepID=A0ABQ1B6D8_9EURO|nr:glycine amidinotransferase, mitochondrial [Aspergillus udagawae]